MTEQEKVVHDWLLANMPEGVEHKPDDCEICASTGGASEGTPEGGQMSDEKTFSETEVDAAIAKAVADAIAPLQARLAEHDDAASSAAVATQIAEAVGPLETKIAELQAELDTTLVSLNAEKERADGLQAEKEQAEADAAEKAAIESRMAERVAVAKAAGFTDDQLNERAADGEPTRAERFAALTAEAWDAAVDQWQTARPLKDTELPPRKSALIASADDGLDVSKGSSTLRQVASARINRTGDMAGLTR